MDIYGYINNVRYNITSRLRYNMVTILDWYGKKVEINPADFANEEYCYIDGKEYKHPAQFLHNKKLIEYCGYNNTLEFYQSRDYPAQYLYNRIKSEVALYLGWRTDNGYHRRTVSIEDVISAAFRNQDVGLLALLLHTDVALFDTLVPGFTNNHMKTFLFIYASCVKEEIPEVAWQSCSDSDAQYAINRWGIEDDAWKEWIDKRIKAERKKLKL